mmetsp:Transcript_6185/g.18427  ORF Transcript_6185/g.18427 Transcript_6185/m.18427 type:complete len:210 (-) Transcript_6185:1678-2307(-)
MAKRRAAQGANVLPKLFQANLAERVLALRQDPNRFGRGYIKADAAFCILPLQLDRSLEHLLEFFDLLHRQILLLNFLGVLLHHSPCSRNAFLWDQVLVAASLPEPQQALQHVAVIFHHLCATLVQSKQTLEKNLCSIEQDVVRLPLPLEELDVLHFHCLWRKFVLQKVFCSPHADRRQENSELAECDGVATIPQAIPDRSVPGRIMIQR